MDFLSHFFIGFLLSALTLQTLGLEFFLFGAIMSMFPDFDVFLHPISKRKKYYYLSHRGGSHSYVMSLIVSTITSTIFSLITNNSFILAFFIGCLFYSVHVTFDLLTTSRIPIFYPLSKREYRFCADRAVNLVLMIVSGIMIIYYLILLYLLPRLYYNENLWTYLMCIYVFYFSYKIITKTWVQARLPKNCQYIPGIFPFVYTIYQKVSSENDITFKLTKKFQFRSKKINIFEAKIQNNTKEMQLYESAKTVFKNYRFFSKWSAIIPIFKEIGDNIILILFLAESYAKGTAYSLKIVFNKKTDTIDYISDGFNMVLDQEIR